VREFNEARVRVAEARVRVRVSWTGLEDHDVTTRRGEISHSLGT